MTGDTPIYDATCRAVGPPEHLEPTGPQAPDDADPADRPPPDPADDDPATSDLALPVGDTASWVGEDRPPL